MRNVLLFSVLVCLAGCSLGRAPAAPPADRELQSSEPYTIAVRPLGPATVSTDGFEARYAFDVISPFDLRRNSLVQELHQTTTITYDDGSVRTRNLSLVEAFRLVFRGTDTAGNRRYGLMPGQRDRHSVTGLRELDGNIDKINVERRVFAYVANVSDADFSDGGFAHLPGSEDGLVVSIIGAGFNADYQRKHKTQGRVSNSATAMGLVYRMSYMHMLKSGRAPEYRFNPGVPPVALIPADMRYAAAR